MGTDPNQQGASRRWISTAVENSLCRLQTDHIDVYQIHRPDPDTDIEETLSALDNLVRSGKIRAFGTSNMPASNLVGAHWVAERRGLQQFRTEQPPYSILNREASVAECFRSRSSTAWAFLPGDHSVGHAHRPGPSRAGQRRHSREILHGVQG